MRLNGTYKNFDHEEERCTVKSLWAACSQAIPIEIGYERAGKPAGGLLRKVQGPWGANPAQMPNDQAANSPG